MCLEQSWYRISHKPLLAPETIVKWSEFIREGAQAPFKRQEGYAPRAKGELLAISLLSEKVAEQSKQLSVAGFGCY